MMLFKKKVPLPAVRKGIVQTKIYTEYWTLLPNNGGNPCYLNTKIYSKNETSTPSPMGFTENLHTSAMLRVVFSAKVLSYSFFP